MAIYYKCEVIKIKKYYLNSHQKKEYLTGDPENDKVLYEASILTGTGISTEEEVVYTGFGETPEEAEKSAKIFACIHLPEHKRLNALEPQPVDSEKDLAWLEERIKKVNVEQ